jgi:hypothetical protein
MGMFDTLVVPHQNETIDCQTKEFECSLAGVHLGDRIEEVEGLRVSIENFESPSLDLYPIKQSNKWHGNRHIVFVFYDGYWIDFGVSPDFDSSKKLSEQLIEHYKNPASVLFAQRMTRRFREKEEQSLDLKLGNLRSFFSAFENRKEDRRQLFNFSVHPKKALTFKNLLEEIKKFLKWEDKPSDQLELLLTPRNQASYFYEGPEFKIQHAFSNILVHDIQPSMVLKALKNQDLISLCALEKLSPNWISNQSDSFQQAFTSELDQRCISLSGALLWMQLHQAWPGLKKLPCQALTFQSGQGPISKSIASHFMGNLGLPDEWLFQAIHLKDDFVQNPLELLLMNPSAFPKTLSHMKSNMALFSNYEIEAGKTPLFYLVERLQHYESHQRNSSAKNIEMWLEAGADVNFQNNEGDTPLMAFFKTERTSIHEQLTQRVIPVLEQLLSKHSFDIRNTEGKNILDLWPGSDNFQKALKQEQKKRLEGAYSSPSKKTRQAL